MAKRRNGRAGLAAVLAAGLLATPAGPAGAQHHDSAGPIPPRQPTLPADRMTRPDNSVRDVLGRPDSAPLRRPNPAGAVGARLQALDLDLPPRPGDAAGASVQRLMPRLIRRPPPEPARRYALEIEVEGREADPDLHRRFEAYVAERRQEPRGKTRLTRVRLQRIEGEFWVRWEYDDYSATFEDGRPCYHWSWTMKADAGALDSSRDRTPEPADAPKPEAAPARDAGKPRTPESARRPNLPPSLDPQKRRQMIADLAEAEEPARIVETTHLDLGPGPLEVLALPGDPPKPATPAEPRLTPLPTLDAGGEREVMLVDFRPIVLERRPPETVPDPAAPAYLKTGNPNRPALPLPRTYLGRPGSVPPGQTPLSPGEVFAREQRQLLEEGADATRSLLVRSYEIGVDTTKTALALTTEAYTPVAMVVGSARDTEEATRRALEAGDDAGTAFLKGLAVGTASLGEAAAAGTVASTLKGVQALEKSRLTRWLTRGEELGAADYLTTLAQKTSESLSVKEPLKAYLLDDRDTTRRSFLGRGLDSLRFVTPGAALESRRAPMAGAIRFHLTDREKPR